MLLFIINVNEKMFPNISPS